MVEKIFKLNTKKVIYLILLTSFLFYLNFQPLQEFLFFNKFNSNLIFVLVSSSLFILIREKVLLSLVISTSMIFISVIEMLNFSNTSFLSIIYFQLVILLQLLISQIIHKNKKLPSSSKLFFIFIFNLIIFLPYFLIVSYNVIFKTRFSETEIYAILQTNLYESIAFLSSQIKLSFILMFIIFLILIFAFGLLSAKINLKLNFKKFKDIKDEFLLVSILIVIVFTSSYSKTINYITTSYISYKNELNKLHNEIDRRNKYFKNQKKEESALKASQDVYIVVLGESLNRNHMSSYNYFRNTTPYLNNFRKNNNVIFLENFISEETHTEPSLIKVLTEINSTNQDRIKTYEARSVINELNYNNFETIWLSNQNKIGLWDNFITALASEAKKSIFINSTIGEITKTRHYDEYLIKLLQDEINNKNGNKKIIFIHLMGNHGKYEDRYPKSFDIFNGQLKSEYYGDAISKDPDLKNLVNTYDNSVIYNDFIISEIIKTSNNSSNVKSLIYFSDHSEDVYSKWGHNSSKFTYDMIEIPFIAWFSENYHDKEKIKNLYINKEKYLSSAYMFESILDWVGISHGYDKSNSIFNNEKKENLENLKIIGTKKFLENDNFKYYQKKNAEILKNTINEVNFYAHRTNSVGSLYEVLDSGLNNIEMDLYYFDKNDLFFVGHDLNRKGLSFQDFLSEIKNIEDEKKLKISKIWIDLKNLNHENIDKIIKKLEILNNKFQIKNKVILETNFLSSELIKISNNGWYISYYLPTNIKDMRQNQQITIINSLTSLINDHVIQSISFDKINYDFIKTHESKIKTHFDYNLWLGPDFDTKEFIEEYKKENYYNDKRVKSVICSFKGDYFL